MKTLKIKLKTGEFIIRKDVLEFFIGRRFFVIVSENEKTTTFPIDNILLAEFLKNGEFLSVLHKRRK